MNRGQGIAIAVVVAGAGAAYYLWRQSQNSGADGTDGSVSDGLAGAGDATTTVENIVTGAVALVSGWKSVNSAAAWLPTLAQTESNYGLPMDLLARMAYQESSFNEDVIRGTRKSSVGALGILQLMPQYFQTVDVPMPFTDSDVAAQIDEAGQQMRSLYQTFNDWSLALAAYNAGAGNVKKYGGIPPFKETQNYVAQITADVPAIGVVS